MDSGIRDRETAIVTRYTSTEYLGMAAVGEMFGVSRETVRTTVRRCEARTGRAILAAPQRWRRDREEAKRRSRPTLAQRLLRHARLVAETGCWEWVGRTRVVGGGCYPAFSAAGEQFAHRVSYRLWRGPIPPAHDVVPSCGNGSCINPFHREAVARSAAAAARQRGRKRKPQEVCRQEHELTPENTEWNTAWVDQAGKRVKTRTRLCRICSKARRKRAYKPPPRRPPLPEDQREREIERGIRRVENAKPADREEILGYVIQAHASPLDPIVHHATENEPVGDYLRRTGSAAAEWYASRILDSPRTQKALKRRATTSGKKDGR